MAEEIKAYKPKKTMEDIAETISLKGPTSPTTVRWGTYKIRVVENIGEKSERTFGGVGTELEVKRCGYVECVFDKHGFKWVIYTAFRGVEIQFNDDLAGKYRTRFEKVKEKEMGKYGDEKRD